VIFSAEGAGADSNFRSIILFGANVASYKFALGQSLLDLAAKGVEKVTLEELADPFSRHLCDHLAAVNLQGTFAHSRFLDACRHFNSGDINEAELITATAMLGFNNVIDAFHVVSGGDVPTRFFVDERKTARPGIRLTDEMLRLAAPNAGRQFGWGGSGPLEPGRASLGVQGGQRAAPGVVRQGP